MRMSDVNNLIKRHPVPVEKGDCYHRAREGSGELAGIPTGRDRDRGPRIPLRPGRVRWSDRRGLQEPSGVRGGARQALFELLPCPSRLRRQSPQGHRRRRNHAEEIQAHHEPGGAGEAVIQEGALRPQSLFHVLLRHGRRRERLSGADGRQQEHAAQRGPGRTTGTTIGCWSRPVSPSPARYRIRTTSTSSPSSSCITR